MICYGKVKESPDLPTGKSYEILQIDKGFIVNQPGVQFINTVSTLAKDRSLPLLFVLRFYGPVNGVMLSAVSLPNHTFTGQA